MTNPARAHRKEATPPPSFEHPASPMDSEMGGPVGGFVARNVRRMNWTLLLANAALLTAIAMIAVQYEDYLYNVCRGPFPTDKAQVLDAIVRPDPRREYLRVDFAELRDNGYVSKEGKYGAESRCPCAIANIGGRLLLIERKASETSAVLSGHLRHADARELEGMGNGLDLTNPNAIGRFPPYVFDTLDDYAFDGFAGMVVGSLLSLLAVWNVSKALRRIVNPRLHPVYRQLSKVGDLPALEAQIDVELAGQVKRVRSCRVTRGWLLQRNAFELKAMRIADLVWLYEQVLVNRQYGVPTGKEYVAVLNDRHGETIRVTASRDAVDDLLSGLGRAAPWAFRGYTEEQAWAWRNHPAGMIAASDSQRLGQRSPSPSAAA